jgi:hypothetical protein
MQEIKPTYVLHKLKEGFIVTSDEEIEVENKIFYPLTNTIFIWDGNMPSRHEDLKVIAQQDQINFSGLSEEKQKKIGWFDVGKLAQKYAKSKFEVSTAWGSYVDGFQKAQELLSDRFSLDDLEKVWHGNAMTLDRLVKYLSQPKSWDIEGEWIDDKFKINKLL